MIKDPQWFCHHLVSETSNWITINQLVGYFNRVDQAVKIKLTSEKIIGREGGDVCTFIKCLIFMHFVTTCTCWKLPVLLHKPHTIFIGKKFFSFETCSYCEKNLSKADYFCEIFSLHSVEWILWFTIILWHCAVWYRYWTRAHNSVFLIIAWNLNSK